MDFYRQYSDLRLRLGRFRLMEGFEYEKTVAAADALANRAKDVAEGCDTGGRFGWGGGPDFTPDALMGRAFAYVEALERGELPHAGRFAEPGGALIDHSFIEKDGVMHLFYNRGYIGYLWDQRFVDSIGHATTTDLVHWDVRKPVLTAEAGGFDDYQVWSPGVIERDGRYWMYYTGVNYQIAQAICLAVSDDLDHWTRVSPQPILTPGPWCPWSADKWSDCRDSMVFRSPADGRYYMYYCSTRRTENGTAPVVGCASGTDGLHWRDEGPIVIPGVPHNAESPFVTTRDGVCYLFFTNAGIGTCWAWSSDPVKGWQTLPDGQNLLVPTCCTEVFPFGGRWYCSLASYLGAGEQYLEIAELDWVDGRPVMGRILR